MEFRKRVVPASPFRLESHNPGSLDDLTLQPTERRRPGAGEVEIRLHSAALNFRDVLKALGVYPGANPDEVVTFGGDAAGTVVAVGPGVSQFRSGDEVMGFVPVTYSSHVTASARFLSRKPGHLTFDEAVTIPAVFLTAYYALIHLARLQCGERILIHAATGGVGLAAVQLSQRIGAEIFATAGSPEKRDYLRSLGIQHVMDSRSLAFADEVMEITKGSGVNVVLNSLAGEFLTKSLGTLGVCGRFLEIGKRDIYDNRPLGLYPFRNNLAFFAIDLEQAWDVYPDVITGLNEEMMELFARDELRPLPYRVFPVSEVVEAFRYIRQTRQIGKVVISMDCDA